MDKDKKRKMTKGPTDIKKGKLEYVEEGISAVLATVPFTGGFAKYLDTYFPTQQKAMLAEFRNTLVAQAAEIDSVRADTGRLAALVTNVVIESARTASEVKREAFRAIVLNYAAGKSASENRVEMFTQLVTLLTELEIQILKVAAEPRLAIKRAGLLKAHGTTYTSQIAVEQVVSGSEVPLSRLAFDKLFQRGLLKMRGSLSGPETHPVTLDILEASPLGVEFLSWISRPARSQETAGVAPAGQDAE